MLNFFLLMIYIGGLKPAYDAHSKDGGSRIWAAINALTWPIDYGMRLADFYEEDEK